MTAGHPFSLYFGVSAAHGRATPSHDGGGGDEALQATVVIAAAPLFIF